MHRKNVTANEIGAYGAPLEFVFLGQWNWCIWCTAWICFPRPMKLVHMVHRLNLFSSLSLVKEEFNVYFIHRVLAHYLCTLSSYQKKEHSFQGLSSSDPSKMLPKVLHTLSHILEFNLLHFVLLTMRVIIYNHI